MYLIAAQLGASVGTEGTDSNVRTSCQCRLCTVVGVAFGVYSTPPFQSFGVRWQLQRRGIKITEIELVATPLCRIMRLPELL